MPASAASISDLLLTVRRLPPLPGGVARILALNPSDPAFFEIACSIVRAEPALATQVLKVANSALYAGQNPVTSVDRAMMRVGARMISTTLTESHLHQSFDVQDETMSHLWLSNAFSANLALTLANAVPAIGVEPEVAYTYGLLHDVGRLVLVALYRNAAAEIVEDNPHPTVDLVRREEEVFGVSHTLAGRLLGNRWKLPAQITLVVAAHHVPRAERSAYPPEINRTIDLMTLIDQVVHGVNSATAAGAEVATEVERLLEDPAQEPLLEAVGVRARDVVDSVPPALAAVERQRRLLGLPAGLGRLRKRGRPPD
jgi:HD-like signal output (HDOD) protein